MSQTPEQVESAETMAASASASVAELALVCALHPDTPADAFCADCGRPICRACAGVDPEALDLCCPDCQAQRQRRRARRRWLGVLRSPAFYVLLTVAVAFGAYALGVGNPSLDDLIRADAGRDWFRRESGRLCLHQVARGHARVLRLAARQETAAMQDWARFTAEAFGRCLLAWPETEITHELRIGQAIMLAKAGQTEPARALLNEVLLALPADHELRGVCLYHRGRAALQGGDRGAGEKDLREVLAWCGAAGSRQGRRSEDLVDQLIGLYSRDRRAAGLHARVRTLCETGTSSGDLRELASAALRLQGIEPPAEPPAAPAAAKDVELYEE